MKIGESFTPKSSSHPRKSSFRVEKPEVENRREFRAPRALCMESALLQREFLPWKRSVQVETLKKGGRFCSSLCCKIYLPFSYENLRECKQREVDFAALCDAKSTSLGLLKNNSGIPTNKPWEPNFPSKMKKGPPRMSIVPPVTRNFY